MLPGVKADEKEKDAAKKQDEPPWFQIDSDHWSYVARAVDGQFPNWKQVVPNDTAKCTRITLQPEAVSTLLDALPLLPGNEETDRTIVLSAGNGFMVMARGRDQSDWTRINVPGVSVIGKSVEAALNPVGWYPAFSKVSAVGSVRPKKLKAPPASVSMLLTMLPGREGGTVFTSTPGIV